MSLDSHSSTRFAAPIEPGGFEPENHYYPRVLNAALHPMVKMFLHLGNERMARRYCHLHPGTDLDKLLEILHYVPSHFFWAGADLFCVTNEKAQRQLIIIETNSCPSGQKSMPCDDLDDSSSGYHKLLIHTAKYVIEEKCSGPEAVKGVLAVVYDKNNMEASGYAAVLADTMNERVYAVEFHHYDKDPPVQWRDRVMWIRDKDQSTHNLFFTPQYVCVILLTVLIA